MRPVPADSAWARRARFLAGLSQLNLKKYDEAFATFKALADAKPTPAVLNNLGVVQLRRGAVTPQTGQPTYYFNKAAEADPDEPDYFFNLGYAYWLEHDPQAAIYWLREAVRRNPADGDAHFVLGAALAAAGQRGGSDAREGAGQAPVVHLRGVGQAARRRTPCRKGLERVKSDVELPHARRIDATLATNERRDQRSSRRSISIARRRLFQQENDREAIVELNRALYLSPYQAEAHLLLGRIHLRNGRVREAIDALKISLWSAETAEAHVVLGEAYLQAKDADGGARRSRARAGARSGVGRGEALLEKVGPEDPPRMLKSPVLGSRHKTTASTKSS